MTEAWLRGPVAGVPEPLMPVAHSFVDAREDMEVAAAGLRPALLWARPGGVASVGFHLRHAVGSLDRLLTYARGDALSAEQMRTLRGEAEPGAPPLEVEVLLEELRRAIEDAVEVLRGTDVDTLDEPRKVGRAGLPSTVRGLLFHAAEHTRRHAGQVVATARILKSGAASPDPRLAVPEGGWPAAGVAGHTVRPAELRDLACLERMRLALWPDSGKEEARAVLEGEAPRTVIFVAEGRGRSVRGFVEVGLRSYAEGCPSSPVAYLEGIWVDAEVRRSGMATALVGMAARWARAMGCVELASDAEPENVVSLDFHRAVGFEDAGRSVCFRAEVDAMVRP